MDINGQMINGQMINGQMINGQMTWNPTKCVYEPDLESNLINSVICGLIYDYKNCIWISAETSIPKFIGYNKTGKIKEEKEKEKEKKE